MKCSAIKELLETTGLPVAYRAFRENEAPPLPYICFLNSASDNFFADGQVYKEIKKLQVELYTRHKDEALEDKVKEALSSFSWQRTETYIEPEKCYQIIFEMEV